MKKVFFISFLVAISFFSIAKADIIEREFEDICNQANRYNFVSYNENILIITENKKYRIVSYGNMKHGKMFIGYGLENLSNPKEFFSIYQGYEDGESGGCARFELLEIEKAFLSVKFIVSDFDNDQKNDLLATVIEQDCKQKNVDQKTIVLYQKENGFLRKEF